MAIAQDEDAKVLFSLEKERPEGMTVEEFGVKLMGETFPKLLRKQKDNFAKILAAMKGQTEKQYLKDLTFPSLVNDVMALLQDPVFKSFLS